MNCTIKNPANHDLGDLETHTHEMYDFFASKYGFKKPPTMVFDSDPSNQSNVLGKTAYYDPQSLEIHIFVDGRHPKDILRSIAHELIHHRQNLEDRLDVGGYSGPGYYLENEELKDIEHEAMLEGNATMREYEDTKKYKENKDMSLNEWKNNELNQLLMKKFGILKENKTSKHDDDPKLKGGQKDLPDGLQKAIIGSTNEELDESNCGGSHKRDDDVSEGKDCEKCKSSDCECEEKRLDEYGYEQEYADRDNYKGQRGKPSPAPEPKELSPAEERASAQKARGQRTMDKASVPRQIRRLQQAGALKEAITKIANAKKIFLKNKRIK
jgi:hypothetical protein